MRKKIIIIIIIILFSIASYIGAGFYNNIHTIIKGQVYRSAQLSGARLEEFIKKNNIKTIINLRGTHLKKKDWYKTEKKVSKENSVDHFDFEFKPHFLPSFTQINRFVKIVQIVEKPYLIHCWRGAERAGMAGALILSIEKDRSFKIIKKQFSIRYGTLFFKDSIGRLFFDEYEKWLVQSKHDHSRKNLLSFIRNDYIDAHGNIKYYIDSVSGTRFDSGKKAAIKQKTQVLKFSGWAYDVKHFVPVKDLYLRMGNKFMVKIENKTKRPDVIKFFGLESKRKNLKRIGWKADLKKESIPSGCYKLFFEFVHENKKPFLFDTEFKVCIE